MRGKLEGGGGLVLETVENLTARIPPGDYRCTADYWFGGEMGTWEIQWPHDEDGDGVPDRDRLLFHPANAVRNRGGELCLRGCIAPGMERVDATWEAFYIGASLHPLARDLPGVGSSRIAFSRFAERLDGVDEFTLRVTEEPWPT